MHDTTDTASAVLANAAAASAELGHDNLGSLSDACGFVPVHPPAQALPDSHAAWDIAAGRLPDLYRRLEVRRALDALPSLPAGPMALPDHALLRAATVLGVLGHAYVHATPEPAESVPAVLAEPWRTVRRRLGRNDDLVLSYADLIVHNWRSTHAGDGLALSDGHYRLLVPSVDNPEERIFYLAQLDILLRAAPIVSAVARAQDGIRARDTDVLHTALATIERALVEINTRGLSMIDPRPGSATYVDPVVWAKTVAPFAVPLRRGVLGPSGTASPIISLLDSFVGRAEHTTRLGAEILDHQRGYPVHWRQFLGAVRECPVDPPIREHGGDKLVELWHRVRDLYAGPNGFLGRHRRKVYGYLAVAFKVGRDLTIGGFAGPPQQRTWNEVDTALQASMDERGRPAGRTARGTPNAVHPLRRISAAELAEHNDCERGYWIAISGRIYDMTGFADRHPGGPTVLRAHAGLDATEAFGRAHAAVATNSLQRLPQLGLLTHPSDPTPGYRSWLYALNAVVEMQNSLAIELTGMGKVTPGPTDLSSPQRADLLRRFRNRYLPWLYAEALAPLGIERAVLVEPAEQKSHPPDLPGVVGELGAIKAHLVAM